MRLLFITRTYPPLIGGMERFASDFYENYRVTADIDLLANSGGKKTFVFFLVKTIFFLVGHSRSYDVVHLYDGVLFPLIPVIKLSSKARVSLTVNGLDIVYSRFGYQRIMPFFLKMADMIIAISQYTAQQCRARGVPAEKVIAIPIGVAPTAGDTCSAHEQDAVKLRYGIPREGKIALITVGRLVARKGHEWFIANVVKDLPDNYIYLIVGMGPRREAISRLVDQLDLSERVFLLGSLPEREKNCLYQTSDLFIMPNIHIAHDQEGFGIVLLEAGRYGLPVIATSIEGIRDAVIDGKTGCLVAEKDAAAFIKKILDPGIDRSALPDAIATHFDWSRIIARYSDEFKKMVLTDIRKENIDG
jgi:glycosyltransferase involved in cell wall biosynthesis